MRRTTSLSTASTLASTPVTAKADSAPRRRTARLAAASLCAVIGLGLGACSSGDTEEVASNNNEASAEQTATQEAAPDDQAGGEENNQQNVFAVKKGDCLQLGDNLAGEVQGVDKRDCAEEHDAEVYAEMVMTDANFPGAEVAKQQAEKYCATEFEPFIGKKGNESELTVHYLHPTQQSWDQEDDRKIQCVVVDPAGGLKGTLQDSER